MERSIQGLRADNNMTQKELAEVLGISVHTLQRYEAGTSKVPFKVVQQIAVYFGIKDMSMIKIKA